MRADELKERIDADVCRIYGALLQVDHLLQNGKEPSPEGYSEIISQAAEQFIEVKANLYELHRIATGEKES